MEEHRLKAIIQIGGNLEWLKEQINFLSIEVPMTFIENQLMSFLINEDILEITCNIPYGKAELGIAEEELMDRFSIENSIYIQEFNVRLHDIFIALQFSNPSCIYFRKIKFYSNEKEITSLFNSLFLPPALDEIEERFIDKYKTIDFVFVWDWLKKQEEFWIEIPSTKIGRFLNYTRYIFFDYGPLSPLWVSMALECLLVDNQSFSKSQITGKLKELLKSDSSGMAIKEYVNQLYKLRSKISHGSLNIYRPTLIHDGLITVEDLDNYILLNNSFGIFSVISCIQYMISNRLYKLEFEEEIKYKIVNPVAKN